MNRRRFLQQSALLTGSALFGQSCIDQLNPKPDKNRPAYGLDSRFPLQYLELGQRTRDGQFSSILLYGEQQVGNQIHYALLRGDLGYNPLSPTMAVDMRIGTVSDKYISVGPDHVNDGFMRFATPVDVTLTNISSRDGCMYTDTKTDVTYSGFTSNRTLYAAYGGGLHASDAFYLNTMIDYKNEFSNARIKQDFRQNVEFGIISYDRFTNQPFRQADPNYVFCG